MGCKCYHCGFLIAFMRLRTKRTLPIVFGVLLVAAAVTLAVQLRKHAPPEPARLLPGADGYLYVNLRWVRTLNAATQLPPVSHDPEYQQFIQETGFQFERYLDQAAFAVHYPASWGGEGTGGPATEPRFSEIFVGRIQHDQLKTYLRRIAKSVDQYNSTDIFNIPIEGRTVRVAILGVRTVAISNHDDPQLIRSIVDRSRKLASPFGGPAFLRKYYKHVSLGSIGWGIVKVQPAVPGSPSIFGGWSILFPRPATVVVSARYIRSLHVKAEAFTASEEDARTITEKATTFLSLFHAAEGSVTSQGVDPDVKTFFESLKVAQQKDRAVLTATIPPGFIRKAFAESPYPLAPATPAIENKAGVVPDTKKSDAPKSRKAPAK